jgi:hypothetical protein
MIPKIGDLIYVDHALYLSHGVDDFHGGLCEVVKVIENTSEGTTIHWVTVKENPTSSYNWEKYLEPLQEELKAKFGSIRAHPDHDYRPEFNDSILEQMPVKDILPPPPSPDMPEDEKDRCLGLHVLQAYRRVQNVRSSLEYISREIRKLEVPSDIRSRVEITCERFMETTRNVLTEIDNLGKTIGTKLLEASSHSSMETSSSIDRASSWLRGEIEHYHSLVLFLDERVQPKHPDSLALMLCRSVGADIIKTCLLIQDQLHVIANSLKG